MSESAPPRTRNRYENPLTDRYGSPEMAFIFSPQFKFSTWRKLWVALAEGEKALGLPITDEQIRQLAAHTEDINFEVAEAREKEVRHDVMAHVPPTVSRPRRRRVSFIWVPPAPTSRTTRT